MAKGQTFEVEIKSLLGDKKAAKSFLKKMTAQKNFKSLGKHKQLNHYFEEGDPRKMLVNIGQILTTEQKKQFQYVIKQSDNLSVRTRYGDGKVIFVLKGAADETTSANGTARHEFEAQLQDISFDELDKLILDSGYHYQAKWSREREEYRYKGMNVTIDKNAGYGYLAEFEKVVNDENLLEKVKSEIRKEMKSLGIEELSQDRLARMFDFYNNNWQDYYGTEKTFVIE